MSKNTMKAASVLVVLILLGATVAWAGERARVAKRSRGLKALGLKVYWSLLSDGQKIQAKTILADHLAATAPDRLEALSRLIRFKGEVAAVLTPEQRVEAARLKRAARGLSDADRRAHVDRLLDRTDRQALADRLVRHAAASPEEKVRIGIEMLRQVYEVLEPELVERLTLTAEQGRQVRAHYDELIEDLTPVAVRLETAKAASVSQALAILDRAQLEKLERVRTDVMEKVLAFLRG